MVEHPPTSRVEVVDTKEQTDSACKLVADGIEFSLAVRLGEKQSRLRLGRSDDDPTLRTSIVRCRRRVLDEVEPQCVDEESDGVVVVLDDERDVLDVHMPTVRNRASRQRYSRARLEIATASSQSRSCQVQMQASLPSGSARIQNARALRSLTIVPPAANAASIRASATSWGTVTSMWMRFRCGRA
jgi:hypothetical protein